MPAPPLVLEFWPWPAGPPDVGGWGVFAWAPAFNVPDIMLLIKFCMLGSCMSWVAMVIRVGLPSS